MSFDVIQFLEETNLNKKLFFSTNYWPDKVIPLEIDESCTLYCKYVESPGADKTVVMFYGNGECVCDYEDSELVEALTTRFHCNCFIAEYRGYGCSTGKLTLVNVLNDVPKIISHLISELGLKEAKLVIFGRSMGGFSLIESLSHFPNIAGAIVESAYSALSPFIEKRTGLTPEQIRDIDSYFNYPEKIKNYHGPVLLIHARKDDLVPYHHCEELEKLFSRQTDSITQFPARGSHNNIFHSNNTRYLAYVRNFLESLK